MATMPRTIRAFHKTFLEQIRGNGRLHEVGLVVGYKLRSGALMNDVTNTPGLLSRGKLGILPDQDQGSRRSQAHLRQVRGDPMSTVVDATAEAGSVAQPAQGVLAYYPGCSLHGTEPEYDESLRAVVEALGIAIAEIPDWNCCGASSAHTTDHLLGVALPARNLALAEAAGFDRVLAPCAACYNRLAAAQLAVAEDAGLAEQMPDILGRPFANSVEVLSVLSLLREVKTTIAERATAPRPTPNPLVGVKLAAYYGCLLVRPPELSGGDDPEQPMFMDEVIGACGAEAVDWNMKVECCGGAFSVSRTLVGAAHGPGDHRGRPA